MCALLSSYQCDEFLGAPMLFAITPEQIAVALFALPLQAARLQLEHFRSWWLTYHDAGLIHEGHLDSIGLEDKLQASRCLVYVMMDAWPFKLYSPAAFSLLCMDWSVMRSGGF